MVKRMKRKNIASLIAIVAIAAAVMFVGCVEKETPTSSTLLEIKTPIWNITDLETEKQKGEKVYIYKVEIKGERPPFYKGSMPLRFKVGYPPGGTPGGSIYSKERPLYYDFGDFANYFVYYKGSIVGGAQTYDNEGHLVAEVSNIYFFTTEENEQGIEIEELHYRPDGKLVFKCKSQIDPYEGLKIKETEKIGRKLRDYYFIWPTY